MFEARAPLADAPRETLEALVQEAARAPSVHNVQPARWRFEPGGDVVLFRALDRALPVADPTGHDVQASLGAAFEGMTIALSRIGLTLERPVLEHAAEAERCEPVVRARIARGAPRDPLAAFVEARRTWRGQFTQRGAREVNAARMVEADDVHVLDDVLDIRTSARSHDHATWQFESRREYHAELWSWLRLSPRDPRWGRDGLNAECLNLSAPARLAAQLLLRPAVFSLLGHLRVARHLVSEAAAVRSSIALVLFVPRRTELSFDVGRRFYRVWLELTAAGLHGAPMSASADDPGTRARYEPFIAADRRLANILRVGHVASARVPVSARLPVRELLV